MLTSLLVLVSIAVIVLCARSAYRVLRDAMPKETRSPARARRPTDEIFVVKPYMQLGDNPIRSPKEVVELLWFTYDNDHLWAVETRPASDKRWIGADLPIEEPITLSGVDCRFRHRTRLSHLTPGSTFEYRVLRDGQEVFKSVGKAPKAANQPFRFVAVGDLASNLPGATRIAFEEQLAMPVSILARSEERALR